MISVLIWAFWLAWFLVFEGYALYRHNVQETFSWEVWTAERKVPVLRWLVAGFLVWLILHFLVGG